jgi:hypothetical protein
MIETRILNAEGIELFSKWLENPSGKTPPGELLGSDALSDVFSGCTIDPAREFTSRLEFGVYLNERFSGSDFNALLAPASDGLWAWLAVVWFRQLTAKGIRRSEHYLVTRKGSAGSLAYRHAVRTAYELVHIHGQNAQICLSTPMSIMGDMTEQLASRQTIAHNRGFFKMGSELYFADGKLRRGSASKPKKPRDRKPGDRTGLGSVRRLALALQRLDLTFDTDEMDTGLMRTVLPREFARWQAEK